MAAKRNITYIKPAEPSFLTKFKKDAGFVEGPTVDTKKDAPSMDDLPDRPDDEDEKPVVVVLRDGDLTREEADDALQEEVQTQEEEDKDAGDGRIVFKKPTKRTKSDASDLNTSSSTKSKEKKKKRKGEGGSAKKVKNSSLLSFGEDEEEEDT